MSRDEKCTSLRREKFYGKMYRYPCGIVDILASTNADFGEKGLEKIENFSKPAVEKAVEKRQRDAALDEDINRSMRRARARVRRLALSNEFRYFVTLTLDPKKVDSHSGEAVVKKLNAWCSNMVQRYGLRYILVPEYHKKGGIHFHGFFNDALEASDSGTVRVPWAKKPRKPKSAAQRNDWLADGGRIVYNLPGWTLGFTTAMELYGEYPAAVSYVCKYIGKDGIKPAGRWYYSGGDLREPEELFFDMSPADLQQEYPEQCFMLDLPGKRMAVVNGVKDENRTVVR